MAVVAIGCAIPSYGSLGIRVASVVTVLTLGGLGVSRGLAGRGARSIIHVGWSAERGWFAHDMAGHTRPFEPGVATTVLGGIVFLSGRTPSGRVLCVFDRTSVDPQGYCALRRRLATEC